MDRLLQSLHLRRYFCGDCGWQSIGRIKKGTREAGRSFAWKYLFFILLICIGAYAFSSLLPRIDGEKSPIKGTVPVGRCEQDYAGNGDLRSGDVLRGPSACC